MVAGKGGVFSSSPEISGEHAGRAPSVGPAYGEPGSGSRQEEENREGTLWP